VNSDAVPVNKDALIALRSVGCEACMAAPGQPCTAPTVSGRMPVKWVHNVRRDLVQGWT